MGKQRFRFEPSVIENKYNQFPFIFEHDLHLNESQLSLTELFHLSKRLPITQVLHYRAQVPVATNFDQIKALFPVEQSLESAISNMESSGSTILIKEPEKDPEFGRFFHSLVEEIISAVGSKDSGFHDKIAYIFISSPNSVTPFHIDREVNFLCQIQGEKTVYLWNPDDRNVVSEEALDRFLGVQGGPRPPFKDEFQKTASSFVIKPGLGVHHPYVAPHWVKNGSQVSVSIALTYRTKETRKQLQVRRVNHITRKLGLQPSPYGRYRARDSLKQKLYPFLPHR